MRERLAEQRLARLHLVPRRRAARMRQRNDVERGAVPRRSEHAADDGIELLPGDLLAEDLADGERSDREHELGLEDLDLALQVRPAARDLLEIRLAIAAAVRLARKAARDRGDVDALAKVLFADAHRLLEPPEERLAGGPRERTAKAPFTRPWRLPDEHHLRQHR